MVHVSSRMAMIADPLKIRTNSFYTEKLSSWQKSHPGEKCFYDHHRRNGERWIGIVDCFDEEEWWISVHSKDFNIQRHIPNTDYIGIGSKVTKEVFFEFLSVKYPNYLEWLLFHPELF